MQIKDQKDTWEGFKKLSTVAGIIIVAILALMAIFLL